MDTQLGSGAGTGTGPDSVSGLAVVWMCCWISGLQNRRCECHEVTFDTSNHLPSGQELKTNPTSCLRMANVWLTQRGLSQPKWDEEAFIQIWGWHKWHPTFDFCFASPHPQVKTFSVEERPPVLLKLIYNKSSQQPIRTQSDTASLVTEHCSTPKAVIAQVSCPNSWLFQVTTFH